jgi:hypothetical protein
MAKLQIVVSLTEGSRGIIYNHTMFIVVKHVVMTTNVVVSVKLKNLRSITF